MKNILVIAALSLCAGEAMGQKLVGDTTFVRQAQQFAIDTYAQAIKGQELFYNGGGYIEVRGQGEEHPYFLNDELQPGSVKFSGLAYNNVYIMYNAALDKVISESPNSTLIVLNPEKLSAFKINNSSFERLTKDKYPTLPQTGYYEILYAGKAKIIALRQKTYREKLDTRKEIYYDASNSYFVFHQGNFHKVKSKGSILKLLNDKKSELKTMIRQKGLRFSDNREVGLARIAEFYDQLTAQ
jgi:hypothetical protein